MNSLLSSSSSSPTASSMLWSLARRRLVLPSLSSLSSLSSPSLLSTSSSSSSSRFFSTTTTTTTTTTNLEQQQQQESSNNNPSPSQHYPHIFKPLELKNHDGVVLPNRILMGSMHTGLEGLSMPWYVKPFLPKSNKSKSNDDDDNHESLDKLAAYAKERAEGGVGLMVTGGIAPNRHGWTGPFSSLLSQEKQIDDHKIVTQAVHDVQIPISLNGDTSSSTSTSSSAVPARICLQILHTGRYAYHPFAVSASSTKSPISPFQARALSKRQIQQTKDAFIRTAVLAKQAGYDGVEIMGSEGYLLSQFLALRTNQRNDEYGPQSLENRARLSLEIVRETRAAVGQDYIIIFRLSLLDLVEEGLSFDESVQIAKWLQDAGVSIINTGIGWHEARVPTIATSVPRGAFTFCTEQLLQSDDAGITVPLVATNRINAPETAEQLLSKYPDKDLMVSMARPLLADPEWVNKAREGIPEEINTCIACNQACLDHVFVGKVASCLVNPRACHETELPKPNPSNLNGTAPLNLAVVGAGPAGCAFAITAAQQGHHVTLYDKDNQIGGQFNMAKRIPGKEEFHETLRYFATMLKKFGVTIKLNTEISHETMESMEEVDKWIIAAGVDPRNPRIPGQDHPNVLTYVDVLKRKAPVGKRVAVIGAGGIGFDVSEYLLHYDGKDKRSDEVSKEDFYSEWGIDPTLEARGGLVPQQRHPVTERLIYLLQRKTTKLGAGLGKTTGWIHRATLNHSGAVEMIKGVKYDKIDENGYLHITAEDGQKTVLEVDNIVICAGQTEHNELEEEATDDLKDKVYTIGGAYKAGELDAKRAIDMGTRLALKIHDPTVVPGKHVFASKPGIEEDMFQMLKRFMK